jgi:hypothetical protein
MVLSLRECSDLHFQDILKSIEIIRTFPEKVARKVGETKNTKSHGSVYVHAFTQLSENFNSPGRNIKQDKGN